MKQINKPKSVLSSAPSTSTVENDVLISQLRDRISRSQDALIQEKDEVIRNLRQQLADNNRLLHQHLTAKDQQCREQVDVSQQQLELERAEHQKTRNLLHQIKMELKDVELYYSRLDLQKESGQRRQRDEEFKSKVEPGVEQEEEEEQESRDDQENEEEEERQRITHDYENDEQSKNLEILMKEVKIRINVMAPAEVTLEQSNNDVRFWLGKVKLSMEKLADLAELEKQAQLLEQIEFESAEVDDEEN